LIQLVWFIFSEKQQQCGGGGFDIGVFAWLDV
jgi:hypothetical protein